MSASRNTTFYIVTYAECETMDRNAHRRVLSESGKASAEAVARHFHNVHFDAIYISPSWRSFDIVSPIAFSRGIGVEVIHDFCTLKTGEKRLDDCEELCKMSWEEIFIKLSEDSDFRETQRRCAEVLCMICKKLRYKTALLGTHKTILTLLLDKFLPDFKRYGAKPQSGPYIFKFEFSGDEFIGAEAIEWKE